MRILIAVHGYPPTRYAGAERAAERIVKWLIAHGHEVEVFALENLDSPEIYLDTKDEENVIVHRLSYNLKADNSNFRNTYDYSPIGDKFRELLSDKSFDLVHLISGYMLGGQIIHVAHEFQIPVVITLTEYWFLCYRLNLLKPDNTLCVGPESDAKCARCLKEEKRRYRHPSQLSPSLTNVFWSVAEKTHFNQRQIDMIAERQRSLRYALEEADLVISPSQFLIDKFAEFGYDTSRFVLVRHGLNMPTSARQEHQTGGTLRLGYIGQIKEHKGVDLIVDAVIVLLRENYNLSLDIWGPEDESPKYSARLRAHSAQYPSIRWQGRYAGHQVWEILSNFDALVVPSRWYENSPTVILEAYNVGLPVIATKMGGMAEMVEHKKTGLLFELNNSADLTHQIRYLIQEPDLLKELRVNISRIKTAEEEVQEIFNLYQEMLN